MTEEEAQAKLIMLGYPPELNEVNGRESLYIVEGKYTMSPFEAWAIGDVGPPPRPPRCPHIVGPDGTWWGWPTMALMLEDLLCYLEEQQCTQ